MREDKPEKVKTEGYGEMGRINKEFSIQQARLYRGLATVNTPTYNQKLWDDDADNDGRSDGFIGAPTARSLTDIAVTISASVFLGPGAALMVGMMDDALFTALDVQNGTDAGQAWGSFGKKAAISVASNYIGGEFAGFQESKFIQDSVFASTGLKAAELTTNMTVSNGINAIDWDDGLAFNTDGFAESFQGQEAWAGVAAGTAGHAVTAGFQSGFFGEQFSIENQKNLHADWGSMALNVNSIGRFAGSVTQGATEYAMTGNTTVNLLNFDIFGITNKITNKKEQIVSSGLLEFNLGKSNNVLEIDTGGIRADYSTLASVAEGIYVLDSEKRIQQQQASFAENVNKYTDNNYTADEMGRLNRMMRAYGDLSAKMQAAKMLSNETDLKIGQNTDGKAQTVMENGKRTVYLNNDLDMNNQNSVFDAIVTLSHEARRDGTAGSESSQTRETRRAVGSHVDSVDRLIKDFGTDFLFGNTEMFKDYVNYKKYGNEYVDGAYDSSADYWKLTTDGRFLNDNDADLYLTNEDGEYMDANGNVVDKDNAVKLIDTETSSISQALIQYVGMDRAAEMLGVNPSNMGNYDNQTLQDVLGMSSDLTAKTVVNGQLSFDSLSLDQQQKLMGELLMKESGLTWSNSDKWHGNDDAEFKITDNWDGYSVGFDQTMTNGEYDKFVVDIVHKRDAMSYLGSIGNQNYKEKYNALDSSVYTKKDLNGNSISSFSVDQVQTVDNLWNSDYGFDNSTSQHPFFGSIQGNTIAPNSQFFSVFGQRSENFNMDVLVSAYAQTLSGIITDSGGYDPNNKDSGRWLTHQYSPASNPWLSSDGCIINNDYNQNVINNTLNNWTLYNNFHMGTIINEDWSELYRNLYGY